MTIRETFPDTAIPVKLDDFPITSKWPAEHPERLQLYSLPTPNGLKVLIALEELGLPYESHRVDITEGEQMSPEFLSLNPNNKIPAIIDPDGPDGNPMPLWESGAILLYLAEKTGKLLTKDPAKRAQVHQWLMFQMGGLGPMFGQVGFFHKYGGKDFEDKRPKQRYLDESARLLRVLDGHLNGREWIVDSFSIADISVGPWLRTMRNSYEAADLVGWDELKNVPDYLDRFLKRPSVQAVLPKG